MGSSHEELETVKKSRLRTSVIMVNGLIDTTEEVIVYVKDLGIKSLRTLQRCCLWEKSATKMGIHTSGKKSNTKTY